MGDPHRVGVVGLGVISRAYLATLVGHPAVRITAVADLDVSRATAAAEVTGARVLDVDRLLDSPDVDTVLNLTVPAAHAQISVAALGNGKRVYTEKPLAVTFADARSIVDTAASAGGAVACAPDTVLGTGTQTARAAIGAGLIGRPLAASAVMINAGPERWHPNPDFYYAAGGGPLLDMGPYYVAALIHLLGPVRSAIGAAGRLRGERVIGSGARIGQRIPVEVDSHVSGILEHASGVLSTITTSFDGVQTTAAPIEVHGDAGTLGVPDPNAFSGPVTLFEPGGSRWRTVEPTAGYADAARGIGLLDAITADARRPPRASGDLALHVLDALTALLRSAAEGRRIELTTTVERPAPVPFTPAADWKAWH